MFVNSCKIPNYWLGLSSHDHVASTWIWCRYNCNAMLSTLWLIDWYLLSRETLQYINQIFTVLLFKVLFLRAVLKWIEEQDWPIRVHTALDGSAWSLDSFDRWIREIDGSERSLDPGDRWIREISYTGRSLDPGNRRIQKIVGSGWLLDPGNSYIRVNARSRKIAGSEPQLT